MALPLTEKFHIYEIKQQIDGNLNLKTWSPDRWIRALQIAKLQQFVPIFKAENLDYSILKEDSPQLDALLHSLVNGQPQLKSTLADLISFITELKRYNSQFLETQSIDCNASQELDTKLLSNQLPLPSDALIKLTENLSILLSSSQNSEVFKSSQSWMLKSLPYSATNFKGFVYFNENDENEDEKQTVEYSFQMNPYYWAKGRQQQKGNKCLENLRMALDTEDIGMVCKLTQKESQLPITRKKIQDLGSLNGTYIIVKEVRLNLDDQKQILLCLGETLMKVVAQKSIKQNSAISVQFDIIDGIGKTVKGQNREIELATGEEILLGKKFFYPNEKEQDSKISTKHVKIVNYQNKIIIIEDNCSLNGMMVRLSLTREKSKPWPLLNEDIISIIDRYEFLVNLKIPIKVLKKE